MKTNLNNSISSFRSKRKKKINLEEFGAIFYCKKTLNKITDSIFSEMIKDPEKYLANNSKTRIQYQNCFGINDYDVQIIINPKLK